MSLKLSSFTNGLVASDEIDYIEVRLGEQYVIPFTVKDSAGTAIDITSWDFTTIPVTSEVYTAKFTYSGNSLTSVANFTDQGTPSTFTNLAATITNGALGQGVVTIPANVNPSLSSLVTLDDDNTMLNIITITAQYPSSVSGFNNIRKLLIGLIVRFGG
jgi:hypothetical protein